MNILYKLTDPVVLLKQWLERKSNNLEYRQCIVRLLLVMIMGTILVASALVNKWEKTRFEHLILIFFIYVILALMFLLAVIKWPQINHPRRMISIAVDSILVLFAFWIFGIGSAAYLFIFTWLCIGNGYRYGPKYMLFASFLSLSMLSILIKLHPQFKQISEFQNGILLFNIIISGYVWLVLNQTLKAKTTLSQMANQDDLTNLPNRAYLADFMKQLLSQSRRNKTTACCIYFDLDGFKQVNDTLGHYVGDKLLIEIARVVSRTVRPTDLVARIAGDEFAVVLDTGKNKESALILANRLLNQIESITKIEKHDIDISASLGIAFDDLLQRCTPDDLLKKADVMMYKAKKAGKRQVVME